jgi:hypothetical protein
MAGMETPSSSTGDPVAPSAVVWINGRVADVASINSDGSISTCEVDRGWWPRDVFLAQVARVIGDRSRVMILGPSSVRLGLEREYVALFHRPDHLVDVEPAGPISREGLLERLRGLAG